MFLRNAVFKCALRNSLRQPDLQKCKSVTSQMSINQQKHVQLQRSKLSLPCYYALWSCKVSTLVEFGGSELEGPVSRDWIASAPTAAAGSHDETAHAVGVPVPDISLRLRTVSAGGSYFRDTEFRFI